MAWIPRLFFAFVTIIAVSSIDYDRACTENEEPTECANSCVRTCSHPNTGYCMINLDYCKKGCRCKHGYVRPFKESEECIELEDCENEVLDSGEDTSAAEHCEENEEPSKCANACVRTCNDPNPPCEIHDPDQCVKGCKCKPSYVRRHGICMRLEDCPNEFYETDSGEAIRTVNECGPNEQPGECVNACVPICSDPKPEKCMLSVEFCAEGCECKPGYVRPTLQSNECIPVSQCSEKKYESDLRGIYG